MATTSIAQPVQIENNVPNAAKLIDSLRHVGYDSYSAIADILDNSIDAEASLIDISVHSAGDDIVLEIVDNGYGMDLPTLDQALRLGSEVDRDANTDLGRYGMGLITASLSMCRRIEVYTCQKGGNSLFGAHDVDEIKGANKFVKECREATDKEAAFLRSKLGPNSSGTIIVLSKTDRISNRNTTQFTDILRKRINQVHRYFLEPDVRRVLVNGKECKPYDPLWLDKAETLVFSDEPYAVKYVDAEGNQRTDELRIRLVLLPPMSRDLAEQYGINMRNQGLSILRNNREIMAGEHFGLWVKHPDLNRFRGELFFSGELDEVVGVNFAKREINPGQAIMDKLRETVTPQAYTLKRRVSSSRRQEDASGVSHDDAAKVIARKAKLLVKPPIVKEIRPGKSGLERPKSEQTSETRPRGNFKRPELVDSEKVNVKYETATMGKEGPIFSADQIGKTTVIQWNIDHPFYERFIVDNKDDRDLISAVDYLIYCMAVAELKFQGDEEGEMIATVKTIISTNMRVLLS